MNKTLRALLQRKASAVEAARKLNDLAATESRDLSDDEQSQIDAHLAAVETLNAQIAREERLIEAERTMKGTALDLPEGARIGAVENNVAADPQRGFAHFGDYLSAVRTASMRPSATDERLLLTAGPSTYANESVGADGGFLVPPQYANAIMSVIEGQDSLLSRVRQIPISGTEFKFPANETTAHGTGGIQAYWDAESDQINQTKPVFKNRSIKVDRLTALVPVTEESLEDAGALGAWVNMEASEKMTFKINDAIINGTGVGQPLGIINAPCTVSVAKEGSQANDTVMAENVIKMWSRMPAANRARAVWLIHSDVEVQLMQMSVKVKNVAGTENVGGVPVWMPPTGLVGSGGFSTLLGRPVVPVESCGALGDLGDIIFADLSQYLAVTKGGVKSDQSMHFWFDQNMRAFRFVYRLGGQPWLSAAISRKNGSSALSHFVTLAAR